jgi:hypothetical protein
VIHGGVVVVDEVTSLEVEDALALVTTDERLITIVAQPLPVALLLLGRGQATERAGRRQGGSPRLSSAAGWQVGTGCYDRCCTGRAGRGGPAGTMASMALARSSKAHARYIAVGRSCGVRIATSTLMWSGRPPTKSSAF